MNKKKSITIILIIIAAILLASAGFYAYNSMNNKSHPNVKNSVTKNKNGNGSCCN